MAHSLLIGFAVLVLGGCGGLFLTGAEIYQRLNLFGFGMLLFMLAESFMGGKWTRLSTRIVGIVLMGVAILISPAQAAVNLPELRDVICEHWETRGVAEPDEAVGADGELGRCQVKAESARLAGSEVKPSKLLGPDSAAANREAALLILQRCWIVKDARTPYELARCYNGGHRYGKTIAALYAEHRRAAAWRVVQGGLAWRN